MVRPLKKRFLTGSPKAYYYKPQGIPLMILEEEVLEPDEFEALKLHGHDNLSQIEAAKKMQISQSTFARILDRAYRKVVQAIVLGRAIRIEENDDNANNIESFKEDL